MSFQYFANQGQKRDCFLSLSNAYHGETLGALSVGDVALYKQTYTPLLLQCLNTPVPMGEAYEEELEALRGILQKESHRICAFILEPLIQCAGNMNMYSKDYIRQACELCREYGVQVIFDEIAVGFGRTGSLFALEQCHVVPDYLCLSKGITGGYLPLSVVVTTDRIYEAFYAPYESQKAFLHSHSYTGNALACSAANAVLDIFEEENIIAKNKILSAFIWDKFQALSKIKLVRRLRHCGMVFAFDIHTNRARMGLVVFQEALKRGLLLRPLGNTLYFMPPYVITDKEVCYVVDSLEDILKNIGECC